MVACTCAIDARLVWPSFRRDSRRAIAARARPLGGLLALVIAATAHPQQAAAQSQFQWWPQLDLNWRPNHDFGLNTMARVTRAAEEHFRQGTLGLHADYHGLRHTVFRAGYRFTAAIPDTADQEHRALVEATSRIERGGFELSNRARVEWRWVGPAYSWRARDRLMAKREIDMPWKQPLSPYLSVEAFYDSRFRTVSRQRYGVGVEAVVSRVLSIDLSYLRQEDERNRIPHVNVLWLRIILSFGRGGG